MTFRLLSSVLALSFLAACQPSKPSATGSGEPAGGGAGGGAAMVVWQQQQEPDALNTIVSNMMASVNATTPVMSGLVTIDDKMQYVPDLAVELPTVENGGVKLAGKGMTVTYKLKPGAKWHDGKPVTSSDVKFVWEIYSDPAVKASSRDGYDKISKVDTPDPHTVVVHFKEVYAPYILLFGAIFPRHLLEADLKKMDKPGDSHFNQSAWNRAPIGSGPYKFKNWVSGDHIEYEANPDYYGTKPQLKGMIMKIIPDENAAFVQLKSQDIDVYQSAALTQYDQLKGLTDVTINETPGLTYEHLDFNLKNPILKEKVVRKALAMAINRKEISEKIYKGLYEVAYSDQAKSSKDFYNPEVEAMNPFDPEKAKQVLEDAGWKAGGDGIRAKDGKRLSFEITTTTGRKPRELTEQVLLQYMKNIGVELKINNVPGAKLFGRPDGLLYTGKYDIAMYAWVANPDPNNKFLWHSKQAPPNGQNYTNYSNPEVDKLTEEGNLTVDVKKRGDIYKRIQVILAEDVPMVPLLYWTTLDAVNHRVKNFKANATSAGNLWNSQEWAVQ
ncbi:MAG: peptide ABC transporter substrate-binding protein [Candidatus Sericytochromatia bacterium]|uniref:Peptide ABC transporter substrate-binding protein n=1 Tax=Candidatus Tanganyikabacteria bacterium TaxID=2961651 RepID=A0A937X5Q8_9BACT|nr:peptide ABC transporter substrate-binding protein [Candidatus Tanganyikabacteria bacterium]